MLPLHRNELNPNLPMPCNVWRKYHPVHKAQDYYVESHQMHTLFVHQIQLNQRFQIQNVWHIFQNYTNIKKLQTIQAIWPKYTWNAQYQSDVDDWLFLLLKYLNWYLFNTFEYTSTASK